MRVWFTTIFVCLVICFACIIHRQVLNLQSRIHISYRYLDVLSARLNDCEESVIRLRAVLKDCNARVFQLECSNMEEQR